MLTDIDVSNAISQMKDDEKAAVAQAEKIVTDTRYTPDYKKDTIKELLTETLAALDSKAAAMIPAIKAELETLEPQTRRSLSPSDDELQKLNWTRDVLQNRAPGLSEGELLDMWAEAIRSGDKATIRVFVDFGESIIKQSKYRQGDHKDAALPRRYGELLEQADNALATPEQLAARERLQKLNKALLNMEAARTLANMRLTTWKVKGDTLVYGDAALQQQAFERQRRYT